MSEIKVGGVLVQMIRKEIKNLHVGVYPPHGRVRVAAPLAMSDDAVRMAIAKRLPWIKRHKVGFEEQPRESIREMVSGESHYFMGRRYRLKVIEREGPSEIDLRGNVMKIFVKPQSTVSYRRRVLTEWYRKQLKESIEPLIRQRAGKMGVSVPRWGIRSMRTRWGTCNIQTRRILFNLELVKKPKRCLEFIIVHELTHFLERKHNERFVSFMNQFMSNWRIYKDELNRLPISHVEWCY